MLMPLMALLVIPTWRILQRAGFNGAWALLMLVPIVGILVLWFVSFLKWPADREGRTQSSKGWLVLGVVLVPLAFIAPVLLGKVAVDGPTVRAAPAAKPCTDIGEFLGECKR
ncbi:hypothetical protein [Acidovorax sp. WCS2018Cala2-18]|nr:hypothetical protein [Acidovorax sp. WCS2018Cala2-18]